MEFVWAFCQHQAWHSSRNRFLDPVLWGHLCFHTFSTGLMTDLQWMWYWCKCLQQPYTSFYRLCYNICDGQYKNERDLYTGGNIANIGVTLIICSHTVSPLRGSPLKVDDHMNVLTISGQYPCFANESKSVMPWPDAEPVLDGHDIICAVHMRFPLWCSDQRVFYVQPPTGFRYWTVQFDQQAVYCSCAEPNACPVSLLGSMQVI